MDKFINTKNKKIITNSQLIIQPQPQPTIYRSSSPINPIMYVHLNCRFMTSLCLNSQQTNIYINENDSIKNVIEKWYDKINELNEYLFRFHKDVVNNTIFKVQNANVYAEQLNISTTKMKKFKSFYEKNGYSLWCDIEFKTPLIYLQIKNQKETYIFTNKTPILEAFTYIKKQTKLDYNKYSFNNKIIEKTGNLIDIFPISKINILDLANTSIDKKEKQITVGSIYLIRLMRHIETNQFIYKIGKTGNEIDKRLGNYGKGGEVLLTIAVPFNKLDQIELDLINIFKAKYTHKTDIGNEYFEGDYIEMIPFIYNYCFNVLNSKENNEE